MSTWNDEQARHVELLTSRHKNMMWVHERSSRQCRAKHLMITIPTLAVTSTVGFFELMDYEETPHWVLGVLALFGTMLTSMSNLLQYAEKAHAHKTAVLQYQSQILKEETVILSEAKPEFSSFTAEIAVFQESVMGTAPLPNISVIGLFHKKFHPNVNEVPIILRIGEDADEIR